MKFPEYMEKICAENKIEFIKGDLQHLFNAIKRIPFHLRRETIHEYVNVWSSSIMSCSSPIASKCMNEGRRAANNYLKRCCNEELT
jgi:hypothetical protein